MKPFIVVPDGFDSKLFNELKNNPELEVYPEKKMDQEKLKELLPRVNALIIRSATKVTKEYVDMAPNLKLVIRAGEGTDNIDKKYCEEKGVIVENTPGANSNSVAEHAIALMFTALRKTAWAHASTQSGKWEKAKFEGAEITGKTIGFVGMGKIAKLCMKRLSGFEPTMLYYRKSMKEEAGVDATLVKNLNEIFEKCDIISLHLPLTPDSKGMINADLLSKMKPGAILINTARGGIVNEQDLYNVLKERKIRAAGFDVFANEPLEENSQLRELDNIVLAPHLGASTEEAQIRVGEMAVHQISEYFLGNKVINAVKA